MCYIIDGDYVQAKHFFKLSNENYSSSDIEKEYIKCCLISDCNQEAKHIINDYKYKDKDCLLATQALIELSINSYQHGIKFF